ncbi:MAG: diguanylate cyclase [Candidatus Latescibacteria bacterium]|jgi:diguanylate cyclase (GGDEF)-like protein|nr:diguanylate cyclase [Candidatus Latescibacterota bacterium]
MADVNIEQRVEALEKDNQSLRQEVARLRADNRRWARLAGTDTLTGLPNKISFLRALVPQCIRSAIDVGDSVGFILLSADNLGPLNEAHGRMAGDQVLKGLGTFLKAILDEEDRLGHIDGSNFSVVMTSAELDDVRARANMLRARVRAHAFPCGTSTAQITVSAGVVAVVPTDKTDEKVITESVFQSLSEALYAAKAAGGNQVQVVQEVDLTSS